MGKVNRKILIEKIFSEDFFLIAVYSEPVGKRSETSKQSLYLFLEKIFLVRLYR